MMMLMMMVKMMMAFQKLWDYLKRIYFQWTSFILKISQGVENRVKATNLMDLEQDFSVLALLTFWAGQFFVTGSERGAVLL